ncbi:hypothetical protein ZWY2020_048754 [Hordeum vulgare]|nr:hypothetical protein ZWY2020_048754 [Hordeum vulgare]
MAASDAAQLKSAREDIKEILKTTYCHSILLLSHCKQFNNVISETTLPSLTGKVHGGRLNFRVFHWIARSRRELFGIDDELLSLLCSVPPVPGCSDDPRGLRATVMVWVYGIVPWLSG